MPSATERLSPGSSHNTRILSAVVETMTCGNLVQPISGWECFPHLARCLPRRRSLQEANTGGIEHRLFGFQPEFLHNRYCILTTVNNHSTIFTSILYSFCFRLFHFFKVVPLLSTYLKALWTIPIV
jgi:hypothetical protein